MSTAMVGSMNSLHKVIAVFLNSSPHLSNKGSLTSTSPEKLYSLTTWVQSSPRIDGQGIEPQVQVDAGGQGIAANGMEERGGCNDNLDVGVTRRSPLCQ